jgi:hypothetical protein
MTFIIGVILTFFAIAIYITIIRWVFRIDYIASLLKINSENTFELFELTKIIKKQNNYSIEQNKVLIAQQERMLEVLEQGIELFENSTEN